MGQPSATTPQETAVETTFVDIRLTGITAEERERMIEEMLSEGAVEVDGVYHVSIEDVPEGTAFAGGFEDDEDDED